MRSRRFDDARIAYLREVSVVATLDALGIYWKRDATFEPVSYTHLDVYKRQVLSLSSLPSSRCPIEPEMV